MKNVQSMMTLVGQNYSVITFDVGIYVTAKEIQWRLRQEFEMMVIRMRGFHVVLNYLVVPRKKYQSSGIEDLLVVSGMYGSSTTSILLKGKSYNRGVRANKSVMDAMLRLQGRAFVQWLSQHGDSHVGETLMNEQVITCLQTLDEGKDVPTAVHTICDVIIILLSQFTVFKSEMRRKFQLFAFWGEYVCMVELLLQFIKAERTGDLKHFSVTAAMTPPFFSMDRPNYSRWLLVYLANPPNQTV